MLNKDNFQTSFTSVYLRKKVLHGLLIYKKKNNTFIFPEKTDPYDADVPTPEFVPGVPSLVSRRKMTLKLNYIYMKVL
jgi:hypothetical protein